MHFAAWLLTMAAALSTTVSGNALPFSLKHVFSGQITIIPSLSPIYIPGGVKAVEQIAGGGITGDAVNGTIISGFAYPSLYNNKTLDVPSIVLFGRTDDNQTFYVSESGVGTMAAQITQINLVINGTKYQEINDGFLLASVVPTNATSIAVEAYLVSNCAS
ncbi:hypothetical protein LARI1_G006931 [Lachnellula arida]|uniref:Secreted protein n=1 Tax=Lachnellula arida TaxID=1316785 RepID=A0A8T9B9F4_9HELO|nr:hypothetical protein LARI1_G006931 [Lachnellula arida]